MLNICQIKNYLTFLNDDSNVKETFEDDTQKLLNYY